MKSERNQTLFGHCVHPMAGVGGGLLGKLLALALACTTVGRAQWVAFNDHAPGAGTHPNTTCYHVFGNRFPTSGPLRNILHGAPLPVTLSIGRTGTVTAGGGVGSALAKGTPLDILFGGYVDFYGSPDPSVELTGSGVVTYTFTGLSPTNRYRLRASAVRGETSYANRWTLCEITGAESFTAAHSSTWVLTAIQVPQLTATQAALQTGVNHTAGTGDYVGWDNIAPGSDGRFAVTCLKYTGAVPGGTSDGSKGYGLTAIRLEEVVGTSQPVAIVSQPGPAMLPAGWPLRLHVGATGNPIFYQWFKDGAAVPGATAPDYTVSAVAPSDSGHYFVVASNQVNSVTSQVAVVTVFPDLSVPLVSLMDTVWKYDPSGADLGTTWKEPGYAGADGWPEGRGVFGHEDHSVVVPLLNTPLSLSTPAGARIMTYYFRTRLAFAGDPAEVYLVFSNLVDDGAVIYLNGEELLRQNMPAGAIMNATRASAPAEEGVFVTTSLFPPNLMAGDNVLAVEVHQQSDTSSDVVFGLSLNAVPVVSGPVLIREQPCSQAAPLGGPASFQVVAAGQAPFTYQWRHEGVNLPNATNATLLLPAVTAANLGAYSVLVRNDFSSATSDTAWLSFAERDLQVVCIGRTPRFPRYHPVYTPYTVTEQPSGFGPYQFTAATSLDQGETPHTQRWPALGDPVTYTATIRNRGSESRPGFIRAAWHWDGTLVEEPVILGPLAPRATAAVSLVRPWDGCSHEVRFSLLDADAREENNHLAIDTRSVAFLSYIDESYYESFRLTNRDYPYAATDDLIDWIQRHMARFNEMFANAGCDKRVHYDVLEVIPDAAPDPGTDLGAFAVFPFRFRAAEVPYSYRRSGFYSEAEDIDFGYLHEMGHQLGMIDIYQLDLSPSANQVSGLGYTAVDGLMRGCSPFLSQHTALGMHHWRDVAHGYFGQYLYGIPAEVCLRFLNPNGQPLSGATVKMYQLCDRPGVGKVISTQIKAQGVADGDGQFVLPNVPINPGLVPPVPTGDMLRPNPFGYVAVIANNGVLHFRVEYEGTVDYAWLDITEANVAYYQGQTNRAVFDRRLSLGGPLQRFLPWDLTETNAADWIGWTEGGAAGGTRVLDDSLRRQVGTTALKFVTDGGFDTYVRYPAQFKARWDLRSVSTLNFWCYAVNTNIGFQSGSPWIRLKDAEGNYFQYQFYENGNRVDLLNQARNQWRLFSIPLRAPAAENNGWRRTTFGTPDLSCIQMLEIHADTWEYGFTLWLDGVSFDPPLRPHATVGRQPGAVVVSWPATYPALVLEGAPRVTGPYAPIPYTPAESNSMVSVALPISGEQCFFHLKVP